ncbi:MAG: glycosyltransferase family 39 protein [Gemmatimonadales bacterium]
MTDTPAAFGLRRSEVGLLLIAAIVARALAALSHPPAFGAGWGGEMPAVAWSLARGMGFASPFLTNTGPTALVPPLYPFLLSGLFRLVGYTPLAGMVATGVNVLLSSFVVLPLYSMGNRLFGTRCAWITAWAWTLYPLTGYTDAQFVWNTSLYTLLLTSFLALTFALDATSSRRRWIAYGTLTALLVLTDTVSLAVVVPSALWLLTQPVNRRGLGVAMLIVVVPQAAWLVRTHARFGQFIFLRSGLGLELSVGVRDYEFRDDRPLSLPNRNPDELQRYATLGEVAYVRERGASAITWIAAHPRDYLRRVAMRIVRFWTGWGQAGKIYLWYGRFVVLKTLLYSIPVLGTLVCLVRMRHERSQAFWLLVAIFALYPVVYYLTHELPRYRLPLEPLMICLTTYALVGVVWPAVRRGGAPRDVRAAPAGGRRDPEAPA